MPAIDAAEATVTTTNGRHAAVSGGISRRSRVPRFRSMVPTDMNRAALNTAWASSITHPAAVAAGVPMPNSTIRKPSWLTVPWASSSLRSCWRIDRRPPNTIVTAPTVSTSGRQTPVVAYTGANRATRYTPAFTIVAEWR